MALMKRRSPFGDPLDTGGSISGPPLKPAVPVDESARGPMGPGQLMPVDAPGERLPNPEGYQPSADDYLYTMPDGSKVPYIPVRNPYQPWQLEGPGIGPIPRQAGGFKGTNGGFTPRQDPAALERAALLKLMGGM